MHVVEVLQPLLAFHAADRPFAEVSRLTVVSRSWRTTVLESLKTASQLFLRGQFAESVMDRDVRLALARVTSENLKRIDLSGCHNISAGCMQDILHYIAETCSPVKEVDVTACSNETVLRAVATRARVALGSPSALDLFALLRSLGEEGKRYSFSNLGSLLHASPPLLLFDPALAPRKNALFQAAAHGTAPEVAMLLSLSFAVGDEHESDEEGDLRTFDVNEKDSEGNAPLLLACRSANFEMAEMLVVAGAGVSAANERGDTPLLAAVGVGKLELAEMLVSKGADVNEKDSQGNSPLLLACRSANFEIAEMLVVAGAGVSAANERGDTPLLAAVGAGKLELAEMLVSKGANVEAVRMDGAGLLSLAIVSQQAELLNLALTCSPKRLEHQDVMSVSELAAAFLNPARIEAWLRTGASPLDLAGQVGALIASCALESSTKNRLEDARAFLFHNLDMLEDSVESCFITLINKREKNLCQNIHRALSGVRSVCYSPDGSKLARAEGSEVVVCDACTGFVQKTLNGHSGNVLNFCFSPDGKQVASGSVDNAVKIWQVSTGTCQSTLIGHSHCVMSVAWNNDGTKLASGSYDKTVRIWSLGSAGTFECELTLSGKSVDEDAYFVEAHPTSSGHSGPVTSVAWSPDGKSLASASRDKIVRIWDALTGQCQSTRNTCPVNSEVLGVSSISYSPAGDMIAVGSYNGKVLVVDAVTVVVKRSLSGHSGDVNAVTWSPDGKSLASASDDETVRIWNALTGQCQSTLSGHSGCVNAVTWSPDGKSLASASDDKTVMIRGVSLDK